jgi:serine/threonine-protein kinase
MTSDDPGSAETLAGGARTGQVLAGKYRLLRLLGRGGMGEVYEARHAVVGRRFAVKFLHAPPTLGSGAAARFLREAQAAGALESPHIAAVVDFDVAPDGAPFMVMEYLAGESLARVLRREVRLPVPRVVDLVLQACAGLAVAHAAGIVHRDLKPDNLFLVERPDGAELLKIVDFGIAKLLNQTAPGDMTQSGAVLGTPYYMAPEQARGERAVDQRVDVHALGLIAYELLCGRKPHPGDSYNAILAHILTEPVVPLSELRPGLPQELAAVIERAMAFEPAARYPGVQDLAQDLARLAGQALPLRGQAVDLGDGPRWSSAEAELETRNYASTTGEAPGTLQSTVGDVPATPASSRGRRALLLVGVAAAAALGWLLTSRTAPPVNSASSVGHAAIRPAPEASARSTPGTQAGLAGSTHALPQLPRAPQSAVRAPAAPRFRPSALSAAAARASSAPSARPAVSGAAAARQVTFDEKNPY